MTTLKQMSPKHCGDPKCVPCAMRFLVQAARENLPDWNDEDTEFHLTGILAAAAYGTRLNGGPNQMIRDIVEMMIAAGEASPHARAVREFSKNNHGPKGPMH